MKYEYTYSDDGKLVVIINGIIEAELENIPADCIDLVLDDILDSYYDSHDCYPDF